MDQRAKDLIRAGRAVLPQLRNLLGTDSGKVESELAAALIEAESSTASWRAEAVRDILFRYPSTRSYLEAEVPAAKSPRSFGGGGPLLRGG